MIRSYLKMAWRNLTKNKLSSFINISGLAVGLATSILIFLVINDTLSYDRFHEHYADIHLLMKTERGTNVSTGSSVPGQLAAAVKATMPEVKYAARGAFEQSLLKYRDKAIYQTGIYTDPDFFRMMTFPAIEGNPAGALLDPGSLVITESAAKKLFGNQNPIGKMITHNNLQQMKIAAVIRDVPENSSYHFDVILPFALFEKDNPWLNKWDDNRILTWVQLRPHTDLSSLNSKLTALLKQKANDKQLELFAYPLKETWLRNSFRNGKPDGGGRAQAMILLGVVGLFVLLIACINFMNLSTARSEHRSREVGVRKTLGASRKELILQFLSEAFVLTFFALFLGVLLARLFLPSFNLLIAKKMSFDLRSGQIWLGLLSIGIFTSLLAGSYPAFFLSRFNPVLVLKGLFTRNKAGVLLRKGLVGFQFMITIVLIISTIVILKQKDFVQSRPIGYDKENLIEIPARGDMADKFSLVKNELMKIPGVTHISAGSDDLIRFGAGNNGLDWPGKTADQDFYVKVTSVQYDWVKTAGLTLAAGRDFSPSFGTDTSACLLNETAVRKMGLKEPVVGTRLGKNTVVGVVKDFIYNDVFNNPEPMIIYLGTGKMDHFFVRIRNNGHWQQTIAQIEQAVKKSNPSFPFEFHFTSEQYQKQFNGIQTTVKLLNWVGVLAILISSLGLFGLSAFLSEQRSKEMGIRKILGAGISSIWFNLSRDFLKPVFIAFLAAAPLAGWAMKTMLDHFDYRISLSWWIFALAGLIAMFIALVTVSFQGIKTARANPVDSLRSE